MDSTEGGVGGIADPSTEDTDAGIISFENTSSSVISELSPDVAALEAAIDAAADANLRIYLVRQDAEAAAMIDEARAAGDALYAAKLKENADAKAAAIGALAKDAAAVSLVLTNASLNDLHSNSQAPDAEIPAQAAPELSASATETVQAEGCPEPWESNPKFSPCRKFMAEFCTLHGTDPRSRCCLLAAAELFDVLSRVAGMFLYEVKKVNTM